MTAADGRPAGLFRAGEAARGRERGSAASAASSAPINRIRKRSRKTPRERLAELEGLRAGLGVESRGQRPSFEPLVCRASDVAAILGPWVQARNEDARLSMTGCFPDGKGYRGDPRFAENAGATMPSRLSGFTQVALRAGLDPSNVARVLKSSPGSCITLSKADALLCAIGEEHALSDGRCPVFRNPRLKPERWLAQMKAAGCKQAELLPLPSEEAAA